METLIIFFLAFDPWRVLLPLGLSMILVVSPWLAKGNPESPYSLVERCLGLLMVPLAIGLWFLTGLLGLVLPAVSDSSEWLCVGGWGWGETVLYAGGVYCVWQIKGAWAQGQRPRKEWAWGACLLFALVALTWILRWDDCLPGRATSVGQVRALALTWAWARFFPKTLHLLLAAMATGGLLVALIGYLPWAKGVRAQERTQVEPETEEQSRTQIVRFGMAWILGGVVPQVVVGSWLLVVLGEDVRNHFLSGLTLGSFLFFGNLLVALLGLVLINAAFIAPHVKGLVWGGWGSILIALYLMGFVRYESLSAVFSSVHGASSWTSLSVWHLMLGLGPMLGLLFGLQKGLRKSLEFQNGNPAE